MQLWLLNILHGFYRTNLRRTCTNIVTSMMLREEKLDCYYYLIGTICCILSALKMCLKDHAYGE